MGCASSQASKITSDEVNRNNSATQRKDEDTLSTATVTPKSINDHGRDRKLSSSSTNGQQFPRSEAFEIPFDDQTDLNESIIKKHPPKRLQRLTETAQLPTKIEDLEEKLAKAEVRRQQFLKQRSEGLGTSAITNTRLSDDGSDNDYDGNTEKLQQSLETTD